MKLYIYDHCPFSMRPRLIAGLKNIKIEIVIVRVADLETVPNMIGKNVRPVLEKDDGTFMAESMDLAHYLDRLDSPIITDPMILNKFEDLKSKILKDYVALTAPLFMKTCREFQTKADSDRYQKREEDFVGVSFAEIEKDTTVFKNRIEEVIPEFEQFLVSDIQNNITATEVALFPFMAHLRNFKCCNLTSALSEFVDKICYKTHQTLLPDNASLKKD